MLYVLIGEKVRAKMVLDEFKDGFKSYGTHCMLCVYIAKGEEWRGHSACASQLWLSSFLDTSLIRNVVESFIFSSCCIFSNNNISL